MFVENVLQLPLTSLIWWRLNRQQRHQCGTEYGLNMRLFYRVCPLFRSFSDVGQSERFCSVEKSSTNTFEDVRGPTPAESSSHGCQFGDSLVAALSYVALGTRVGQSAIVEQSYRQYHET
jgi:hypothetical protein